MSTPLFALVLSTTTPYWPFWVGGLALASVSVGTLVLLRRPLGVSGTLARVLDRDELRRELRPPVQRSTADLEAELMAATLAAFGAATPDAAFGDAIEGEMSPSAVDADGEPTTAAAGPATRLGPRLSWSISLLFLLGIVGGGALAAATTGRPLAFTPDETYAALFGTGWLSWFTLFVGGVLVGVGTQLSGGCTSGHGLVGCGMMRPGSLAATASFFGTGILVSILLSAVLR
jgi:uncharacterized membrane protein YedE/YeeE